MAVRSFSSCLAALAAAAEDPVGLGSALSELRSRYVSRVGGAERFRSSGGLAMLINLLTDPSGAAVLGSSRRGLELGLSLLANGCTEPGSRVQVRELGGIPALISILKSICIDSIWNRVCRALGNLAVDFQNNQIIHESGAVSSLVQILQNSQDVGCLQSCLRALRILGDSPAHRLSICQQGGLAPCVQMLTSPNSDVVCEAVRAVCELSRACSLECAAALNPAVPTLMTLASEEQGKTAVRQAAFGTLCNLCIQGALRPILGNAGLIKLLITEATAVQQSPTRCLPVVKALCFCCREAVNRVRVREHGGLELLLELLRSFQYRSVHYRIIVAFLYYCYDNAALSFLVSSGLTLVLAERLEECMWAAEERRCVKTPMEALDEEEAEEEGSTSYDFPQETRKKREQGGSSEESLRSWLLSEGYITSLDDLPPESIMERENREEPTRTMLSPPGKGSQKVSQKRTQMSDQLCFSSPSDQSCQSPIKEIFASPSLQGPPSPAPSVVYGPEFPILLLLSRFSQLSDSSSCLVSPPVLKGLLTYVTCHPNPSDQAARILQRLTSDPLCLQAFIRTGSICTLRARLLLQESPDGDEKERSRHPKRARKLGDVLMRNLCIQAASSFGVGLVSHMLVSGPQNDRQQCALCLPFIYRKDSPHRQNLLDGAIRLVLESLMISVDPVYYFHASECLSSILTPQTSERRSSLPTQQASACRSPILTPQTSERRSSLPTPQASACQSPILIPQTSECRSSLLTPKALERRSSISTPQALECPSSILTPQDSPAPPKSSSPTSFTCCYLKLFSQGQGDIVFVLDGGERLEGSRDLICKSSDVFHAMLQGGYAESQQCEVRVREIPVSAFLPLLHYLHGCSQDSLCPTLKSLQQLEPEQELVQSPLSSTLAAAGQFLLPGLQCVLENLVRDSLLTLDRLPSVYNFAEMHECAQLRRDCCMYLLKRLHPPQRRARTLFQLCEQAQDKQKLTRHLEDVLQRRD